MENKFEWLEKKTPRSIDQLRLWNENPRLNPEEKHITLADFTEDLIAEDKEKRSFFDLLKSIAAEYIPADPIIVWKDEESQKFYVAEGNRRVLALKLLNDPNKAPKSIRAYVRNLSKDRLPIEKIKVNVAPSFEDAEWYICQRNSMSTLQQKWSRIQQIRWVEALYKKYGDNMALLSAKSSMPQGEIEAAIRNLRLVDLINTSEVRNVLSEQQYKDATSYKFPITILERFFSNKIVKDQWGIEFDGMEVRLKNRSGFVAAYAELIKNIVDANSGIQIDTRTITSDLKGILAKLPKVDTNVADPYIVNNRQEVSPNGNDNQTESGEDNKGKEKNILKGDPNRSKLILPIYEIHTLDYRLQGIFNELKCLSVSRYKNAVAASVRIFLDLAVLNWLQTEDLVNELQSQKGKNIREITLHHRLVFVAEKLKNKKPKANSIIVKLTNDANEFSLNVLNGYQHSKETVYLDKQFLNRFWDFLFPLFQILLDIKENSNQNV